MLFSPNKPKNGGITAGIVRAGTGKDSATGNGVDDSEEVRQPACSQMLFFILLVIVHLSFAMFPAVLFQELSSPHSLSHTFMRICNPVGFRFKIFC